MLNVAIENFIPTCRERIEAVLQRELSSLKNLPSQSLIDAIQYSVANGGKRLRPLFIYTTGIALDASWESLDVPACAIEFIHTYSLIHDDLPAMDDDDFRRGKPSCHKAFGEAMAILAGDALQTLAFELLSQDSHELSDQQRLAMVYALARQSGIAGMAAGQALDLTGNLTADLKAKNQSLTATQIENIHRLKTGALFTACVELGAIAANQHDVDILKNLRAFADCIGLAFQIQDDLADVESTKHAATSPLSYVACVGVEAAKTSMRELHQQAFALLNTKPMQTFPHAATLFKVLCDSIFNFD